MRQLFLVLTIWGAGLNATGMRRIAQIPSGPYHDGHGRVVCCDSDHDSLPEMIFYTVTGHSYNLGCYEVWEHQGWNRFSLVFADTGNLPGTRMLTPILFAAGDVDNDGLTDMVGITVEYDSTDPHVVYDEVITLESPDSFSYPSRLSWYCRYANNFVIPQPTYYLPDLDGDGHKEIFSATPSMGGCLWENVGNDSNDLVWVENTHPGYRLTWGDFDMDGKMNFASASLGSSGTMSVWECTGDNQYEVVYQDTVGQPNGADLFMTNDIDGNGLPEFYVAYENVPRGKMYLYMWEAYQAGTDSYRRTLVDSVGFSGTDWGRISECGDVDGDGIDELIWTTPDQINVYKALVGGKQRRPVQPLQEVWHWDSDHNGFGLVSTAYDINNDGYNELITAGNGKVSVFEVDAVDLLYPNRGTYSIGDTIPIRWVTHTPPRCDSLSLFLRRDSLWSLDTIAAGLPGTDTLYRWVVPSGVPETARVVVIAYGPGHQYDISDSVIYLTGGGVAEDARRLYVTRLRDCSPNPLGRATTVSYELARGGSVALSVHDVSGRLVRRLEDGFRSAGPNSVAWNGTDSRGMAVPAGVYFVRFSANGVTQSRRVTLVR